MSESPKSEKCAYLTRFSTPVAELDDDRFQLEAQPEMDNTADIRESFNNQQTTPAANQELVPEMPERHDLLQVQDALRPPNSLTRDFENAVIDDSHLNTDAADMGRRLSAEPTGSCLNVPVRSRSQQDRPTLSRESSFSAKSSSPPNSVEAFADPRRRERANTLESHAPPDLEAALQRTVSAASNRRHPTFSNASAIKPQLGDVRLDSGDETGVAPFEEPGRVPVIDYEELEEFVAVNKRTKSATNRRKHSLSSQGNSPRVFHDLRPSAQMSESSFFKFASPEHFDAPLNPADKVSSEKVDEKELVETLQNENEPTRFSFFSSESQSTVHAAELGDLVLPGDTFRDLFQLGPEGGVWWLDIVNPTEPELEAISRAFSIHPLTTEDIMTQEAREKVELFKQYYFVCFRTFYQLDNASEQFLDPVNMYMVVFRDGVLTFSFTENPHAANVRKRIGKLRDYVSLSSDWICYAMM